jgi:RNA polymerase sigma-70 factor (ECF subfamily)
MRVVFSYAILWISMAHQLPDPDESLVREAQTAPEGDLRAFERLMEAHQRRILADCEFMTRDPAGAEDLAQEVFVKAYFGLAKFEGRSSFRHWLQRIKVHHCLNHLKRGEGREVLALDEEAGETFEQLRTPPAAERNLETRGQQERISGVLRAMPALLRVPLIMRDMDELPYEEIAAALGIGLSAAKMRVKRAREQFRRLYEGAGSPEGDPAR